MGERPMTLSEYVARGARLQATARVVAAIMAGAGSGSLLQATWDGAFHAVLFLMLAASFLALRRLLERVSHDAMLLCDRFPMASAAQSHSGREAT